MSNPNNGDGDHDVDPTQDTAEFLATDEQLRRIFLTAGANVIKSPYARVLEQRTLRHASIQLEVPKEFLSGQSEWEQYDRLLVTCDVETPGADSELPQYTEIYPYYEEEGVSPTVSLVSMDFQQDFETPNGTVTASKDVQFFNQEDGELTTDILHQATGPGAPEGRGDEALRALIEAQLLGLKESISSREAEQLIQIADSLEYIR